MFKLVIRLRKRREKVFSTPAPTGKRRRPGCAPGQECVRNTSSVSMLDALVLPVVDGAMRWQFTLCCGQGALENLAQ